MNEQDRNAKAGFIDAYFDNLQERVDFLAELWSATKQDEALTLCCCYIDGIANHAYWDADASAHNFASVLMEFGGEPDLLLHSPLSLVRWMEKSGAKGQDVLSKTLRAIPEVELRKLFLPDDFYRFIESQYRHNDFGKVKKHLWRGSVAYIAYTHLRNPFVHNLAGSGGVLIGADDSPQRIEVGFPTLYRALKRILVEMRERSVADVKWYGHDFRKNTSKQ